MFIFVNFLILLILLFSAKKEFKIFYIYFILSFTLLPFLISSIWLFMINRIISGFYTHVETTNGLSDIVAGFYGFLIMICLKELDNTLKVRINLFYALSWILLTFASSFILIYIRFLNVSLFSLLFIPTVFFYLLTILTMKVENGKLAKGKAIFLLTLIFVLIFSYASLLFPYPIGNVDILGHYIGTIVGIIISFLLILTYRSNQKF